MLIKLLNLAVTHRQYIYFIRKSKSSMRVKAKKEEAWQTPKTVSSKKHPKSQNVSKQLVKLNLNLLSHTLYCPKQKSKDKKIVFYDEFQSEKQDIDGAITSRFLPHQSHGGSLLKCKKVQNLSPRQQNTTKRKNNDQGQRKMSEARTKKKQKILGNQRVRDDSLRSKLMGLAYVRDS